MKENLTQDIKNLVKKGKENGYILLSELNNVIETLKVADQQYIRDGMEELKIQVVKTPKDYDEFMSQIIKRNNIQLPVLPGNRRYQYDPEKFELVVVEAEKTEN